MTKTIAWLSTHGVKTVAGIHGPRTSVEYWEKYYPSCDGSGGKCYQAVMQRYIKPETKKMQAELEKNAENLNLSFKPADPKFRTDCSYCRKPSTNIKDEGFKKCSRCKSVYYCDQECQKLAWPKHKLSCVPFEKVAKDTKKEKSAADGRVEETEVATETSNVAQVQDD